MRDTGLRFVNFLLHFTVVLCLALACRAQGASNIPNTISIQASGAPSGACGNNFVYTNSATNDFYNCVAGAWNKVTGGGGGSVSLTATAPVVMTPSPTTGTGVASCPTCLTGTTPTNHGVLLGAGTQALGVTAAGTTGQILTGVTGADPVWGASSGTVTSGGPRQLSYYSASAASVSGLISPLTIDIPPTSANSLDDEFNGSSLSGQWTQTNIGTSTLTESGGVLAFAAAAATGSDQLRILSQSVPGATPYTVTCKFNPNYNVISNTHQHVGMFISDGTKYVTFTEHWTNGGALNLETNKWTNVTTFSAAYKGTASPVATFDWQYLSIQNDGTNLNFNFTRTGAGGAITSWDSRTIGDFLGSITTWGIITENLSGAGAAIGVFDWCRRTQ